MTVQSAPPRQGITGWHVLGGITAFFVVIVGLDIWFAVLAYRTAPGQTAKDPYEAGLHYQQTLKETQRELAVGWQARVEQAADGGVELVMTDHQGQPLDGLSIEASLTRPATQRGKVSARFEGLGGGRYRLKDRPSPGAWDLEAVASNSAGGRLALSRRLQWS